jgi:hypothetical protein
MNAPIGHAEVKRLRALVTEIVTDPAATAQHVLGLCHLRRRAKQLGEIQMTHQRRAARLVLQGILDREEAEDALAVLTAAIGKAPAVDEFWLWIAQRMLEQAIETEAAARHRCELDIRAACETAIARRLPSAVILARASDVNDEHGRLFAYPQLRELVGKQLAWFVRQQRGPQRGRRSGHG